MIKWHVLLFRLITKINNIPSLLRTRMMNLRPSLGQFQDPFRIHCANLHTENFSTSSAWSFCSISLLPPDQNLCLHWYGEMSFGTESPILSGGQHVNVIRVWNLLIFSISFLSFPPLFLTIVIIFILSGHSLSFKERKDLSLPSVKASNPH